MSDLAINVVVATTKVQIFKQITTITRAIHALSRLLLLPQRYKFSSKSQQGCKSLRLTVGCCCYHKGTNFQANHNIRIVRKSVCVLLLLPQRYKFSSKSQPNGTFRCISCVVVATTKVQIFKQITTAVRAHTICVGCCCYHKGTNFQANHNMRSAWNIEYLLLLLPQRYKFSSKSQLNSYLDNAAAGCCCYHKGTNFQANHNS